MSSFEDILTGIPPVTTVKERVTVQYNADYQFGSKHDLRFRFQPTVIPFNL